MLMNMTRADSCDVGLGRSEHDLVVGISFDSAETLGRIRQSLGVGIGDGDDLGLRNLKPDGVFTMPVVALAGMADDTYGQGTLGALGKQERGRQGQGCGVDKIAAVHGDDRYLSFIINLAT